MTGFSFSGNEEQFQLKGCDVVTPRVNSVFICSLSFEHFFNSIV